MAQLPRNAQATLPQEEPQPNSTSVCHKTHQQGALQAQEQLLTEVRVDPSYLNNSKDKDNEKKQGKDQRQR